MRKADTIEGLTDKAYYLQSLVDAGNLVAIEPCLKARKALDESIRKKDNEINSNI